MATALQANTDDHLIAWFAAAAICIHVLESALPSPLPGIKPGLANIVTLLVLYLYGWRLAAWVAFLRVLVGSLIIGSFLSPAFFLSFSGAMAAIVALRVASILPASFIGPLGAAVLASCSHMAAQFFVAYHVFIPHPGLWNLIPVFMTAGFVFGIASGVVTNMILEKVKP